MAWPVIALLFLGGLEYSSASFSVPALIQLFLLFAPVSVFYALNDVYDRDTDMLNPRKMGGLDGVRLHPRHHKFVKRAVFAVILLLVLSSLLTFNVWNILVMALFLFVAYSYSAPPLRLKERPPLDSISNGLGYFLLPFLLGFSFGQPLYRMDADIIYPVFCVMGLHAFSTLMDYGSDKEAGVATFSTRFGIRPTIMFSLLTMLVTLLFAHITYAILTVYLLFCSLIFVRNLINTNEETARDSMLAIYTGFFIVAAVLAFGHFSGLAPIRSLLSIWL